MGSYLLERILIKFSVSLIYFRFAKNKSWRCQRIAVYQKASPYNRIFQRNKL